MPDIVDPQTRSRMMSGIRGKNTKPEYVVRRGLHARGFRYRLHDKRLPGHPDLVLPKYQAVIFVNGCFWHGHSCHLFRLPSTREDWWRTKIERNKIRDLQVQSELTTLGWRVAIVWECSIKGKERLPPHEICDKLERWLRDTFEPMFEVRGTGHETGTVI